jgi:hypothetical protein
LKEQAEKEEIEAASAKAKRVANEKAEQERLEAQRIYNENEAAEIQKRE